MSNHKRDIEFKKTPSCFDDDFKKVKIFKRKVIIEKTEAPNSMSKYQDYMASFMEDAIKDKKELDALRKSPGYYDSLERKAEIITQRAGVVTYIRTKELRELGEVNHLLKEKDEAFYSNFDYAEIRKKLMPNLREILEKHRLERIIVPKKVLIEKNNNLKKTLEEIKKRKQKIYDSLSWFLTIKSKLDDKVIDVTSFENIDFNKPCSVEELEEIKKKVDYYVYQDCLDEINCEIKTKEIDGVDLHRLGYGEINSVTSDIADAFMKKSERITEEYYSDFFKKLDKNIEQGCRVRRRVLFEKLEIERPTNLNRYQLYFKSNFGINI